MPWCAHCPSEFPSDPVDRPVECVFEVDLRSRQSCLEWSSLASSAPSCALFDMAITTQLRIVMLYPLRASSS